ncbi:hypothetical protein SCOR_30840 [Sulfidibacter corallicola]
MCSTGPLKFNYGCPIPKKTQSLLFKLLEGDCPLHASCGFRWHCQVLDHHRTRFVRLGYRKQLQLPSRPRHFCLSPNTLFSSCLRGTVFTSPPLIRFLSSINSPGSQEIPNPGNRLSRAFENDAKRPKGVISPVSILASLLLGFLIFFTDVPNSPVDSVSKVGNIHLVGHEYSCAAPVL